MKFMQTRARTGTVSRSASPRAASGFVALAACLCIAVLPAEAQTTKTDTTFEDWLVSCNNAGGAKVCTISQTFSNAQTKQVVLALILGLGAEGALTAVAYTPTGVLLPAGLTINAGELEAKTVPYRFCGPQACTAEFGFEEAWIAAFRKQTEYSVSFQPVGQPAATIKGSLKGFSSAYDYFLEQKSVAPPAPAN